MGGQKNSWFSYVVVVAIATFLTACATYQLKVNEARRLIRQGQPAQAADKLQELAYKSSDDQLIYLLDYAMAQQEAGNFKESNKALLLADKLADIQDYHSISRISGSFLLGEEMVQYKGEDYEKVLINSQLAINFLMLNELDSALVECRRLNEKLYKFKHEAKKDYGQNVFALYLAATIWEADKKWDDAYIDYKKAYDLLPSFPYLKEDLLRVSYFARRMEEHRKWKKKFSIKFKPEWKDPSYGELILVYQQGWAPRKRPRPGAPRYPKLFAVSSQTEKVRMNVTGTKDVLSEKVFSVEDVAIKTLEADYKSLVARRVGGVVAKAVVADQIRQNNEALGDLAWIAMNLADRADLRQWSTLPESFHVARTYLPAGEYDVQLTGLNSAGHPTGETSTVKAVKIRPGKKAYISWRSHI